MVVLFFVSNTYAVSLIFLRVDTRLCKVRDKPFARFYPLKICESLEFRGRFWTILILRTDAKRIVSGEVQKLKLIYPPGVSYYFWYCWCWCGGVGVIGDGVGSVRVGGGWCWSWSLCWCW